MNIKRYLAMASASILSGQPVQMPKKPVQKRKCEQKKCKSCKFSSKQAILFKCSWADILVDPLRVACPNYQPKKRK